MVAQSAYQASDAYDAAKGGLSQNGTDGGINLQIGIGGSSASSTDVPPVLSSATIWSPIPLLEQMIRAATGQKDTSHNCYGNPMAPNNCGGFWMNSPDKKAITLPVNMEGKD